MKLLSIDSATPVCSVSLYMDGESNERFNNSGIKSSSLLLPMCEDLLSAKQVALSDLDGIVYSKGPGTFTGVRMTIGVVQGLVLASAVKSIGITTLETMATAAYKRFGYAQIAVAIDARMEEVYWQMFDFTNAHSSPPCLLKPNNVPSLGNQFVGVGSGWQVYNKVLSEQSGISRIESFDLRASMLTDLVLERYVDQLTTDFDSICPLYLRNRVAEKSVK